MRSPAITGRLRVFSALTVAGASVLVFHSAALAQQPAPAADAAKGPAEPAAESEAKPLPPQDLPPVYAPPPGYRHPGPPPHPGYEQAPGYGPYYAPDYYGPPGYPPPPRYYRPRYYAPAPVRYYPEPTTFRPFFFGFGLGVGGVGIFPVSGGGSTSTRTGVAYNLHFGFGVSPRWSLVLSGDGAYSYFDGYNIDQSVWSIGPQVFITRHLYARAGIGVATKSVDTNTSYYSNYYYDGGFSDSGMGWTAALGFEFLQSYHSSVGLEAAATMGHYQNPDLVTNSKNEGTIGVNFVLNLF